MKLAIVTDTNSGIAPEEAEREGIYLLHMPVIIDEKSYLEGMDITVAQLQEAMKNDAIVSTSQPSPASVTLLWDSLLKEGYERILHIPMTSGLSGSCQSAVMLAKDYHGKVLVVDNHRISVTQRSAALEAKRMADLDYSAEEIKTHLEDSAYQASIYLTVESLKYLQRGGRLSPSAAMLGTILNIKPVLSIQGELIEPFAKMRGMKKSQEKMIEALQNDITERFSDISPEKLQVYTAGTLQDQEAIDQWTTLVQEAFPTKKVDYCALPCSITCHVGPGCAGIGVCVSEY